MNCDARDCGAPCYMKPIKPTTSAICLLLLQSTAFCLESVELTTGPHVSVNYDSNVWKPLSELRPPAPGTFQSLTWELQDAARIQITVTTHSEQKAEEEFKKD